MNILAIEFSAPERSVAVARRAENGQVTLLASVQESEFRTVTGLMLIDRALKEAKVAAGDINTIALGLGPGSYAGIRAAIAIAQGWQLAHGVKVFTLGSDLILAETARGKGFFGELTIIVDAQRGEVYMARYQTDAEGGEEIQPLKIVPAKSIVAGRVIGPEASKFVADAVDLAPSAAVLATLAVDVGMDMPAESLEPFSLRESTFVKAAPARNIS